MKAWDYRLLTAAVFPLALLACPADPVPAEDDDGSATGSTTAPATTATTDDTLDPPSTTTTDDPTATSMPATSDSTGAESSGTTSDPDTGDSGEECIEDCPVCNNNILEEGEVCDLNQLNGETCASLGYQGGVLGCQLDCTDYNLLGCFICGNEVIDIAEDCEGGVVPEGVTCQSLGFEAGDVTCGADCLFDLTECSICGDGIQAGPEDCDGIDLGGETCVTIGFDGGNLGCNLAECQYSYAGCFGGQYIQNFEGGAPMPGEFTLDVVDPWFVDDMNPLNGSFSARSGPLLAGGITDMELTADYPVAGNISFDYETSCGNGIDFLEFYIDGVLDSQWSGLTAQNTYSTAVAAGTHTFRWTFNRAGFVNKGLDAVFVDDITLDGGVPL